jgi:hypothetical protein
MEIAGKWVGYGLGPPPDADDKLPGWKNDLRHKFSKSPYAAINDTSRVYTEDLAAEVARCQRVWGYPVTGIIDAKFRYKMGWDTPPPRITGPRGTLYTCQGTVPSDMWWGPQADVARAVEDLYYWQPIFGPYQPFPMNNSIDQEKATLRYQIARRPPGDPINAFGYSQGAIVVSEVYQEMKNPADPLHYRLPDWKRVATIGNPCRQLGVANGNKWCGYPSDYPDLGRNSRGIMQASRRLTDTPDWWMDFAHRKDLYTDTPNTEAGENQTAICMIIMGNWFGGSDDILHQLIEFGFAPTIGLFGAVQALINAGMFFGGGTKPHVTYNIEPCKVYFRS